MYELIKINPHLVGNKTVSTINARELHAFLKIKSEFRHWIKNRIEDFGFLQNQDFATTVEMYRGGERKDYHITLDMAKEVSMVERNEKGKQARQYFIECERRAKGHTEISIAQDYFHQNANNSAFLRGLLSNYCEKVIALEHILEELKPKAEFHDKVTQAKNCQTLQEVAKVLGSVVTRFNP